MSATTQETVLETVIEASALQEYLKVMRTVSNESRIHLGRDGFESQMVDPAGVAMAHVSLEPHAFELVPEGQITVGVNLERLVEYIDPAEPETPIELSFNEETGKLHILFEGHDVDMARIDPDSIRHEPDLPDVDPPCSFVADAGELQSAVKYMNIVRGDVRLRADAEEGQLVVNARGDTDEVARTLERDDLIDGRFPETVESLYSYEYLNGSKSKSSIGGMFKSVPNDAEITGEFGTELPVRFQWDLADGYGSATYILAPKIDSS